MQTMEWNRLQRGDVIRYIRKGTKIKKRALDRTVVGVRVGSDGGRYITLTSEQTKSGTVEYPTAVSRDFMLVMTSTDTARREIKRVAEENEPVMKKRRGPNKVKKVKVAAVSEVKSDSKTIMVRFSISGVTEKPINAEFAINQ